MSRFGIRTIPATVMVAICVSAAFCTAAVHAQTAGADNSAIYLYKGADRDQRLIAKARVLKLDIPAVASNGGNET